MKIPKTLAVLAVACIAVGAKAQQTSPQLDLQGIARVQTYQVKESVTGMTADQETKILAIETNFSRAMVNARNSSDGNAEVMHSLSAQLHMDRDSRIKAVLTASQYSQYEKMEAAKRQLSAQDGPVK